MEDFCVICGETNDYTVLFPCSHSCICTKCFLTLTQCYNQKNCPICQKEFEKAPLVTEKATPLVYSDEIKHKDVKYDKKFNIFYTENSILEKFESYLKYQCPKCGSYFTNKKSFQSHLNSHGLVICQTCFRANRFLNIDVPIFTKKEIKIHDKQHPKCPVCPFVAFDAHELDTHMFDSHIRCDVCARHDRILWFATLDDVRMHNMERHYPCEHPDCLAKGAAFDSDLELQIHQKTVHGKLIPMTTRPKEYREREESERTEQRDHDKRHYDACKRFVEKARALFKGDQKRLSELLHSIDALNDDTLSPREFMPKFHEICGDFSEAIFTDMMSTITNPKLRAYMVRLQDGYRVKRKEIVPLATSEMEVITTSSNSRSRRPAEDFPSLESVYTGPKQKPKEPKKEETTTVIHTSIRSYPATVRRKAAPAKKRPTAFEQKGGWANVKIGSKAAPAKGRRH